MFNKVFLVGRLGNDPDLRYTQNQTAVVNFSLATSEYVADKNGGEGKEHTEWHKIVVWQKQAENCHKYLVKGSLVHIEGKIQTRQWEDKDGSKRYSTEVVAQSVKFLSPKGERTQGQGQAMQQEPAGQPPTQCAPDDIPF
jgi:single-strand DNA-binding protein